MWQGQWWLLAPHTSSLPGTHTLRIKWMLQISTAGLSIYHSSLWHAADTPPLEGLSFLACGWSAVDGMLYMLTTLNRGLLLTTVKLGPQNVLPLLLVLKRSTELSKAFWRWCFERWEKGLHEPVTDCTWNMKIMNSWCICWHSLHKPIRFFDFEPHAYQSNWISMLQTCLNKSHKMLFFCLLASKSQFPTCHPYKGS